MKDKNRIHSLRWCTYPVKGKMKTNLLVVFYFTLLCIGLLIIWTILVLILNHSFNSSRKDEKKCKYKELCNWRPCAIAQPAQPQGRHCLHLFFNCVNYATRLCSCNEESATPKVQNTYSQVAHSTQIRESNIWKEKEPESDCTGFPAMATSDWIRLWSPRDEIRC